MKRYREVFDEVSEAVKSDFAPLVVIRHHDGTTLFLTHAYPRRYQRPEATFIAVQTEHHGLFIYNVEDLDGYSVAPMWESKDGSKQG